MIELDPKVTIDYFLVQNPSMRRYFEFPDGREFDGSLTLEEYCFMYGLSPVSFIGMLQEEVNKEFKEELSEMARKILNGEDDYPHISRANHGKHHPFILALLILAVVFFGLSALANYLVDWGWLRTMLGIHTSLHLPHVSLILCLLDLAAMVGGILLLLWRRMGMIVLFTAAMLNDILVVALTDSFALGVPFAITIFVSFVLMTPGGVPYYKRYLP